MVALFAVIVAMIGGVYAGQKERNLNATQTTEISMAVQFDLGVENLNNGLYDLALERFYWIRDRQPDFPGLEEIIAEAEYLKISADTVLNPPSTDDPISTDLGTLFAEAESRYAVNDWERVIEICDQISAIDPSFNKIQLEEMLYTSLKTLGLSYIRGDRLEEGIFLLDRATSLQPLDDVSEGEIYLANLYITAKSYWNINWPVTIANLQAILVVAPDYKDASEKLFEALLLFGDQLMAQRLYCDAETQYQTAADIKITEELQGKLSQATDFCINPPTDTPAPPLGMTPTLTMPMTTQP